MNCRHRRNWSRARRAAERPPTPMRGVRCGDSWSRRRLYEGEGRRDNRGIIAEALEPMDIFFAAKPGHLALGELACGALDIGDGLVERQMALKMPAQFGIADELERFRVRGNA